MQDANQIVTKLGPFQERKLRIERKAATDALSLPSLLNKNSKFGRAMTTTETQA